MAFYKQDIVDINLNTGNIHRSFLNHAIGYKNDDADRFGIRTFRDGVPQDLTGASCQAVFMAPNGSKIALTSYGTVSGNVAYVTLPPACYDYEGQFCLAIQLVGGGVTGTMRIVDGMVVNTGASGTVAPTSAVPTYQEIIAQYDAMVAATAAANGAIAATYSGSATYKIGDYCIHDGGLYRCTTAITTAEAWNAAHWTSTKIGPDVSDLKSATNNNQLEISTFEDTGKGTLSRGNFDRDVYNPSTGATNTYQNRISARKQIVFPYAVSLVIASGFRLYPYKYQNNAWTGQGWQTGTYNLAANTPIYAQISRTTEDSSEIANIATFLDAVKVVGNPIKESIDNLDFLTERSVTDSLQREELDTFGNIEVEIEQGSWGYSNGLINNPSTSNRLRSKSIFRVKKGDKIIFRGWNVICAAAVFSGIKSGSVLQSTGWINNVASRIESVITINYDGYVYFNFAKGGDPDLTPSDYDGYTYIANNFAYNLPEKAVHVYQFGGKGNDWCFVRTPENYNPERAKPYPFVICNHGNGWVMDGTIQKANWTKRTMYVPLDDSDYIADPTEYNGTWVAKLQYSNPTIEALLTAGYIVCGCENYGDNLYGNNNCRNACVDFFYHMTSHYNVENRCYMIGASNGAMTSLNAAYLMQGAVKAMILQYPLTCLVNQYEHPGSSASGHPAAIRAAYGITDADITEAELTKAVATHDPLTVDVVSGVKVGVFPPTKLYYSPNDVVVNCQYNALALATMLDNSNKVVVTVQCSGEHGDHSHFAPDDYVDWFDEN